MILLSIVGVIVFSLVLIRATDVLTDNLKELARKTKLGDFFLASLVIGIGTTLPELFVGITSALEGVPTISLGNALGSNVADLSIIAGAATLIGGGLIIKDKSYTTDFFYSLFAGVAPVLFLIDGNLTRMDGLILLCLYGYYNYALLHSRPKTRGEPGGFLKNLFSRLHQNNAGKNVRYLFFALTVILISADIIVRNGQIIAEGMGVPIFLVGLFLIAIGTSLPELAFGIRALRRGEPQLFLGDLLGATVANTTLIIGITALIHPIGAVVVSEYLVVTAVFVAVVFAFLLFLRTKYRITRWEGIILIFIYLLFFLFEVYRHYSG